MLNTFPKTYLNSEPIPLVVRSMVLPRNDAIFMVLRPLKKLGDDSSIVSTMATPLGTYEFNSYVSYILALIKAISILVCTPIT